MISKFDYIEKNPKEFCSVKRFLFHGSNLGKVEDGTKLVCDSKRTKQNLEIVRLYSDDLKKGEFINICSKYCEPNIFGNKTLISLYLNNERLNKEIINFLTANNLGDLTIIIKSDQLSSKSSIRSFFEKDKKAFIIACYEETENEKITLISKYLENENIHFSLSEIKFLSLNLPNKRLEIKSEVEKIIIIYKSFGKHKSIQDMLAYISEAAENNPINFILSIVSGKSNFFIRDYNRFTNYGSDNIKLLSYLADYLFKILTVKQRISEGMSLSLSMKKLRPPIFFKHENLFEKHVKQLDEKQITMLLRLLYKCKKNFLKGYWSSDFSFLIILLKFFNVHSLTRSFQ